MFYLLVIAILVGWYKGGDILYRTHHGMAHGVEPSDNLWHYLFR
jgi:hypothetical protein